MPRGRFAPSPTGPLHLGGARTALIAWLAARSTGSTFVLRMEDLDGPRLIAGAAEAMMADLRWLGLDWDEGPDVAGPCGPYDQSERIAGYDAALSTLAERHLTFACHCSRADIARAASAPHVGEEGPRYPGTCRGAPTPDSRPVAIRFRIDSGRDICFADALAGQVCQDVGAALGDFVLKRADGVFAYQLAVVVDDIAMGIEQVVRGDDLLSSTPRQLLLYEALGATPPAFAHVPLIYGPDGQRLSKRHGAVAVQDYRAAGWTSQRLTGWLAASLGLAPSGTESTPSELIEDFAWERMKSAPPVLPAIGT